MRRSPISKQAMSGAERQQRYFARQGITWILELIEENLVLRLQLRDAMARGRPMRAKRQHKSINENDEIKRLRRQLARTRRVLHEEAHAPKRTMQIKGFDV